MKYENFNFDNINSLHYFYDALTKKILIPSNKFEVSVYNQAKGIDNNRYGTYFHFKNKKSKMEIWPWMGLWFPRPMIYIEIGKDWCKNAYKELDKKPKLNLKYSKEIYHDTDYGDSYIFELKDEYYKTFLESVTEDNKEKLIKERIDILIKYFNETFNTIVGLN